MPLELKGCQKVKLVPRKINRIIKINKTKCRSELSGRQGQRKVGTNSRQGGGHRGPEGGLHLGLPRASSFPVYNTLRYVLPVTPSTSISFVIFTVKSARLEIS